MRSTCGCQPALEPLRILDQEAADEDEKFESGGTRRRVINCQANVQFSPPWINSRR